MVTVACVLKKGGDFHPEHVQYLKWQVERHSTVEHRFVCLTDALVPGVDTRRMFIGWPGWWSKVELFDYRLFNGSDEQVVYFDLDTVIVGNIDSLLEARPRFAMLEPFNRRGYRASGIMSWHGDFHDICHNHERRFSWHAEQFKNDQNYIAAAAAAQLKKDPSLVNDHVAVVSYKWHCRERGKPEPHARIVCFHGKPRPWEVEDEWVKKELRPPSL